MKKVLLLSLTILLFSCSEEDDIIDETPIITLIGEAIVTVNIYSTYTDAGATAQDNEDGNLTSSIITTGGVNEGVEGEYVITYTVSDSSGNTATTSRQVIVEDDGNPVYLAENGVTIKAKDWALIGDSGVVNGIGYTIVDLQTINDMISNADDITRVCTSRIIDMKYLFSEANSFNQDISSWDVSSVTNMRYMFLGANSFNQDISSWDVSIVNDMGYMFSGANSFNQDISSWDVSSVNDIGNMFYNAFSFNQPLNGWDTSNVTDMSGMFLQAPAFNQPLNGWDTSSVTNMSYMFREATAFNQNIGSWDVSNVTDMSYMFQKNNLFNQDLSSWDVNGVTSCSGFSQDASLTDTNTPNFTNCDPN